MQIIAISCTATILFLICALGALTVKLLDAYKENMDLTKKNLFFDVNHTIDANRAQDAGAIDNLNAKLDAIEDGLKSNMSAEIEAAVARRDNG